MTVIAADTAPSSPGPALRMLRAFNANKTSWVGAAIFAIIVILAILAPVLSPHDPTDQNVLDKLQGPSAEYLLGTDAYGRDILSRLLYGARISLVIGIASILMAMVIGSAMGILAGWVGGRLDALMMQVVDVMLSFPSLILGLIIVAMLGPSLMNLVWAIALAAIPPFVRIARAPTLTVKQRDFIEACRALGFSDLRIMVVHILPNVLSEILVMGSLWLATAIRVEASLAFVGLGVKPPIPTWGGMIREGFDAILDTPWLCVFPGLAIVLLVFSLNMIGDGLRDAIDPKLRNE